MNKNKRKDIVGFLISLAILILVNFIGSFAFLRLDLTSENRYSISEPTRELLNSLEEDLYVQVYLEGDFPASFKRLRNETREMLDEFQAYSGGHLDFEFINPSANPDMKERDKIYKNLYELGLRPTDLEIKDDDGVSQKVIWPGAVVSYKGNQIPIQLLKSQFGAPPQVVLNQSIESLEYELASAIKKVSNPDLRKIAMIQGHGELDKFETADIVGSMREFYEVERVLLNGNLTALSERIFASKDSSEMRVVNRFDAAIVAGPDSAFSEKDKFILDQFVMYGGKLIWLVDGAIADMDSLRNKKSSTFLAMPKDLNLQDQFFEYGVRINQDLVQDMQAAPIPAVSGQYGTQAKTQLFPWLYYPLMFSKNNHPINKNLDVVKADFASSIDLVGGSFLEKSVILSTSKYTKLLKTPTRVSMNMLSFNPPKEQFTKQNVPIGVLVEGEFKSIYRNRLTSKIVKAGEIQYKEKSPKNQMVFISDGDLIKNRYNKNTNQYYALGFDRYTNQFYGNKDFFMNILSYLLDDSGLILSKTKSFKIRMLNTQLVKQNRLLVQVLNTALPILVIILIGLLLHYLRRKKYTR
ncbi:MAG: gliding motility-associated ABC transporter substrate-binding protein GldG [Vicingaceae bacterium]